MQDYIEILSKYMPEDAAPVIAHWVKHYKCHFKVSRARTTKFGDYRPPQRGYHHRISVNHDLNPFAFLVTTVHEFAHLHTWEEYKNTVKPHGDEWKRNFQRMMQPFFDRKVFPDNLAHTIVAYLKDPAASSCNDIALFSALRKYDKENGAVQIATLENNTLFMLKDGRTFRKEYLRRKRFACTEIRTGRLYLFSPVAEVYLVNEPV